MKNPVKLRDFPDVRSGFSPLFEWAFGPRNFAKNPPRRTNVEHGAKKRRGFSPLFEWAFGPRNPMKKPVEFRNFPDVRSGFSPLSFRGWGHA
jgi:hypothetical protein